MKKIATIFLAGICLAATAQPLRTPHSALRTSEAVRAIIGEAAGEPFQTKLAIAGALRNRGTLDGVRGRRNARMIDAQPAWVWRDARRAWAESATNDISRGGTFFESINFPAPAWAAGMRVTATVGKFRFYKL